MAEFPALPLFTDAYLADTRHLTAEEHGAYLLLLMCAWRTRGCRLRDDDRTLARLVGVTAARWRKLRPVLMDFFTTEGGYWQQKKLCAVYEGVQERVTRNRENGAKGGRAKAAKLADDKRKGSGATSGAMPDATGGASGAKGSRRVGQKLATKARVQTPKPEVAAAACPDNEDGVPSAPPLEPSAGGVTAWRGPVAAAAGLTEGGLDLSPLHAWQAAGADLVADVLPVIDRLKRREAAKGGKAPQSLNYYTAAVLEARDARLGAVKAGASHAETHPGAPEKQPFDRTSAAHWRLFLGDATSRFRGDYLATNWHIGPDHPHFLPASLGPDPRLRPNPDIPEDVFADYAPAFRWRRS
ncbi:YdaU family protein [Kordiimonas marina]|uniref:YdaU family protein n=1 Tax=Kordiimonas marina TaxID=2872312 RepID=UPI001FF2F99A|nr:DUF1376 domain-containing protein [Kordiimonas marina]MCJ9428668.1 DUF1376 domain-containing protein [Kordiimonas marina]